MVSRSELTRFWKTCCELACWISRVVGSSTYLWLSSPTTTAIRRLLGCCLRKHFIDISFSRPCIGTMLVRDRHWGHNWFRILVTRYSSLGKGSVQLRVSKRVMLITGGDRWSLEVGNRVFLNISPIMGVMRFGKKGKLSPRSIGPFEITQRVGRLVYRVTLPPDLTGTHDVFHMSMLRKYITNFDVIVEYKPLGILEGLTYV